MKNKFYASLLIWIGLTLTSTPSLAKSAQLPVKKQTSGSAKPAKSNAGNKKTEQSIVKKASSNTVAKQKPEQTKSHQLVITKDTKHDKSKPHSLADAKDSKHGKSKSNEHADDKDGKHGKSKTTQLADAKDNKHGKSKFHGLADAKNGKHNKQLADAKGSKHSRKKSHQVEEETYEDDSEEDTTTVAEDTEKATQTAEETNSVESEAVSQETDTRYREEKTAKSNELIAAPPKSSPLFFQPLDKNTDQALTENRSIPNDVSQNNQEKAPLLFSAPNKTDSEIAMANNRVHTSIGNDGIKFSRDNAEEKPFSPSTPRETNDALIQPSQDKKRFRTAIARGNSNNLIDSSNNQETSNHVVSAHGVVDSSLASAGEKVGLSEDMVVELTEIFAWDIDFANNLQAGDQFTIIYEEGAGKAHNKIIAAQFINNGKTYTAIRYKDKEGIVSYYTPEGKSTRKAFLSTPVDFAQVSSHFSTHRRHPILNRIRAHKGVDYAARTGTPVKAAGDGIITFHGTQGGYGNMIVISHGDHYETAYAHLSKFRKDLQDGEPVKQGDIIGYVGQSGLATGPHLHYEFRVDGVHRDPENLDSKQAMRLGDEEWDNFHAQTTPVLTRLNQAKANGLLAKK